jgi:hypothetical protein
MEPLFRRTRLTKREVSRILENFIDGKGDRWDWDDFVSGLSLEDDYLEKIRTRCDGLSEEFPPDKPGEYCNEQGREVIRGYIRELRNST